MAKIMFIGSIPGHVPGANQEIKPEHKQLFSAARQLGLRAANDSHRVLLGSSSPRTIDFYVAQGVKDFCEANPNEIAHIEIHRPENEPANFDNMPSNIHFLPFGHYADPSSPHKWIVAHARALDHADVVVTIGGGTSTRLVGHLAADRGKALIAIPTFGGASEELFQSMKYSYRGFNISAAEIQALLMSWQPDSAEKVIQLGGELHSKNLAVTPHSYFISYSWKDCSAADHVETLLRREKRPVLRDETDIQVGGQISAKVQALIEDCDTFIALWSENSESSSWCPKELEYAHNLHDSNDKPRRIVLLKLDNAKIPFRQSGNLYNQGVERKDRELAVLKLIRNE